MTEKQVFALMLKSQDFAWWSYNYRVAEIDYYHTKRNHKVSGACRKLFDAGVPPACFAIKHRRLRTGKVSQIPFTGCSPRFLLGRNNMKGFWAKDFGVVVFPVSNKKAKMIRQDIARANSNHEKLVDQVERESEA